MDNSRPTNQRKRSSQGKSDKSPAGKTGERAVRSAGKAAPKSAKKGAPKIAGKGAPKSAASTASEGTSKNARRAAPKGARREAPKGARRVAPKGASRGHQKSSPGSAAETSPGGRQKGRPGNNSKSQVSAVERNTAKSSGKEGRKGVRGDAGRGGGESPVRGSGKGEGRSVERGERRFSGKEAGRDEGRGKSAEPGKRVKRYSKSRTGKTAGHGSGRSTVSGSGHGSGHSAGKGSGHSGGKGAIQTDEVRLNKYIAASGICSRREADELISAGLIVVNGKSVTTLGTKVKPGDEVKYNGERIRNERKVYLLLNKPKDFVTTTRDPRERKTVMTLVKHACPERIYPVGRLDRQTTGVLLFTNDGALAKKLTHPSYNKKKIYHVFLNRAVKPEDLRTLAGGIELEDGYIQPDAISYVESDDKKEIGLEIHSGRNRVVRRMFESLGYRVEKLDRVYFAGLTKKNLPRGKWRFLTENEISRLKMNSYE